MEETDELRPFACVDQPFDQLADVEIVETLGMCRREAPQVASIVGAVSDTITMSDSVTTYIATVSGTIGHTVSGTIRHAVSGSVGRAVVQTVFCPVQNDILAAIYDRAVHGLRSWQCRVSISSFGRRGAERKNE